MDAQNHHVLIVGCGYLGQAVGSLLAKAGFEVTGLVRSAEAVAEINLRGWKVVRGDLTMRNSCESAAEAGPYSWVVHCAASGRGGGEEQYRAVYLDGCRHLLELMPDSQLLFTSSTSVYPQIDGSLVTEEAMANPMRGTGQILRATEDLVLGAGGTVVRLAGIYGPGRSVLLRQFLEGKSVIDVRGETPATPDGRWINQIHRDDAAGAICHLLSLPRATSAGQIYNVADATPLLQRTVYRLLAERFQQRMPPEALPDETRKRGWTNKRVSNSKLLHTGWNPLFPSYFDALEADPLLIPSILEQLSPGSAR